MSVKAEDLSSLDFSMLPSALMNVQVPFRVKKQNTDPPYASVLKKGKRSMIDREIREILSKQLEREIEGERERGERKRGSVWGDEERKRESVCEGRSVCGRSVCGRRGMCVKRSVCVIRSVCER